MVIKVVQPPPGVVADPSPPKLFEGKILVKQETGGAPEPLGGVVPSDVPKFTKTPLTPKIFGVDMAKVPDYVDGAWLKQHQQVIEDSLSDAMSPGSKTEFKPGPKGSPHPEPSAQVVFFEGGLAFECEKDFAAQVYKITVKVPETFMQVSVDYFQLEQHPETIPGDINSLTDMVFKEVGEKVRDGLLKYLHSVKAGN